MGVEDRALAAKTSGCTGIAAQIVRILLTRDEEEKKKAAWREHTCRSYSHVARPTGHDCLTIKLYDTR